MHNDDGVVVDGRQLTRGVWEVTVDVHGRCAGLRFVGDGGGSEQIAAEIRRHQQGNCGCERMGDCELRQIEIVLAALRRQSAEAAWQPIETAPKDGTPILGCRSSWVYPSCMVWLDGPELVAGWHSYDVSAQGRKPYNPTHWMPLPAAQGSTPTQETK